MVRYSTVDGPVGEFNVNLLRALQHRWSHVVRPDTSMTTVLFTRSGETGYDFTERVRVTYQRSDQVEMALERDLPRTSLAKHGGRVVVTGDFTRPENALPAVEALLYQLADPEPDA